MEPEPKACCDSISNLPKLDPCPPTGACRWVFSMVCFSLRRSHGHRLLSDYLVPGPERWLSIIGDVP